MSFIRFTIVLAALACCAAPSNVQAQTVLARVIDDANGQPIVGAQVYLLGADGEVARSALTDDLGRALFVGVFGDAWSLRAEMIGRAMTEIEAFGVDAGETVSHEILMASSAIVLEGIEVAASGRCEMLNRAEGLAVADVWNEARKALAAASITDQRGLYRYETVRYDRQIDAFTSSVISEERQSRDSYMRTPFESRPADELVRDGFVQQDAGDDVYYAPDATALLSDVFLNAHCFRLARERNEEGHLGLEFEPTEDRGVPDVRGVLWLDASTGELQWLEYRYTGLRRELRSPRAGGRVDFRRLPDGSWIVPEWWIRMPVIAMREDFEGNVNAQVVRFHETGGLVTDVREAGGRGLGAMAQTGGIEGVVRDSLGVPLRGVRVGVVGSNQEVYSNAEGRFGITSLPAGRYRVSFTDERLDIMGYRPEPIEQDVVRGEMSWLEYVTPSVGDVLFEACRDEDVTNGFTRLAGLVVDRAGDGVPLASVRLEFSGFRMPTGVIFQDNTWMETTTTNTGFFKFCGVPPDTRLMLDATLGDLAAEQQVLNLPDYETGRVVVLRLISGTDPGGVPYQ